MSVSIKQEMDQLPETSVTIYALRALDFVIPGVWQNVVGFENMITHATGISDPAQIKAIGQQAEKIFDDPDSGYRQALQIYKLVDTADAALGAAAMANKVGERISFLSFLSRFTPKADVTQSIDLAVKMVAELVAFTQIKGIPSDQASIGQFAGALSNQYSDESLMRMVALVSFDGLVPLGPDFTQKVGSVLGGLNPTDLENNATFQKIQGVIPGDSAGDQLGFITSSFGAAQGWINNLVSSHNLTPQKVTGSLKQYVEFTDDKLDYLAAFLDMSTLYFSHTGTQTVAHSLISEAAAEV